MEKSTTGVKITRENTPTDDAAIHELAKRWRSEHEKLENAIDQIRDWACDGQQSDSARRDDSTRYGEAAQRLTKLRQQLVDHFARDNEIVDRIAQQFAETPPELEASRRQASHDHLTLLRRLDDLVQRLQARDPSFDGWDQVITEFDLLIDALDQHEEQHAENMHWLAPGDTDSKH